jgi:hypothetical protein
MWGQPPSAVHRAQPGRLQPLPLAPHKVFGWRSVQRCDKALQ